MQLSSVWIFAEDNDTASTAYSMKGRQYDFSSSTVIISEFAAFDLA